MYRACSAPGNGEIDTKLRPASLEKEKPRPNVAYYAPQCVDRIKLIRHLQKHHRLSISEIHEVLTWPATHDEVVAASALVPDDVVQRCTASGTADEARAKVAEYMAAGCTCPVLYPLGPDPRVMIDAFADF